MKTKHTQTIAIIGPKGIPKDFPGTSGIEAYVENQIPRLAKTGETILCYVRSWANHKKISHYLGARLITISTINTVFLDTLSYSLIATTHAMFSNATVVWYHGIGPAVFSFIPKAFGRRVITTIHSLDWNRKKWQGPSQLFLLLCERVAVSHSDVIYVVSTELQSYYRKRYNKETVVDTYTAEKKQRVPPIIITRKYHLKKNGYILYLGRFVPEKRVEWLIRASVQVNCPIVLAGGSSHTDSYVKHLIAKAGDRIIFTGYVFGKEKAELLSNCKFLALPSMMEGYPISVVDAMSYGRKCLVGDFLRNEYSKDNALVTYFQRDSYPDFVKKFKRLTG